MTVSIRSTTGNNTAGSGGGSLTVTVPSIVSGDVLLAHQAVDGNLTMTAPVNASYSWSQLGQFTNSTGDLMGLGVWICAAPSAGSSVVFTHASGSGGEDKSMTVMVLTGASGTQDAAVISTGNTTGSGGNYVGLAATATNIDDLMVAYWVMDEPGDSAAPFDAGVPASMSQQYTAGHDFLATLAATEQLSASGSTGTRTATNSVTASPYVTATALIKVAGGTGATVTLGPSRSDVTIHP